MAGDSHVEEAQEAIGKQVEQEASSQGALATGGLVSKPDSQDPIAERDRRIESLERKLAKEAANKTAMEALTAKVSELEAKSEIQRVEYELKLAGCRSVKAGLALLEDHGGDVNALKEAEPWLFADAPAAKQQSGTTGLPNAGTSTDSGKTMRRWRRLAGLDDSNDNA